MSELTFARPVLLAFSCVPFFALFIQQYLLRLQQRRWLKLGNITTLRQFLSGPVQRARWRVTLLVLTWLALTVAVAGPRWGTVETPGVAAGRDIIIVLDFSRSMWAEDINDAKHPSRWQAAIEGAKDLVRIAKQRGGDRLGLVVFAAQPFAVAPLTTDYDHLLLRLESLDARAPPAEILPASDEAPSGTRLGAALQAAVALHDERFPGFQEIVLFTDAHDPVSDDEWRRGASAARAANIPVHVIGIGDPTQDSFILRNGEPLEGLTTQGIRAQIQSRLHEEIAQSIALETRGGYLASNTQVPNLAEFYRTTIASHANREVSDERRPQPHDRSARFYAITMFLMALAWGIGRRRL